jgi:hypothetical protein
MVADSEDCNAASRAGFETANCVRRVNWEIPVAPLGDVTPVTPVRAETPDPETADMSSVGVRPGINGPNLGLGWGLGFTNWYSEGGEFGNMYIDKEIFSRILRKDGFSGVPSF